MHDDAKTDSTADWYFDLLSPFAYLQLHDFGRLPPGVTIVARPVLLGGLLRHWGQIGPAEIAPKRLQTYRICVWKAEQRGVPFRMPERHPFNPLQAMRLMAAVQPSLAQVRSAFDMVFAEGRALDDEAALMALGERLGVEGSALELAASDEAKAKLRQNTDEAIARGVFGVPTFHLDGEIFWGDDATGMFSDYVEDRALFTRPAMKALADLPVGVTRQR